MKMYASCYGQSTRAPEHGMRKTRGVFSSHIRHQHPHTVTNGTGARCVSMQKRMKQKLNCKNIHLVDASLRVARVPSLILTRQNLLFNISWRQMTSALWSATIHDSTYKKVNQSEKKRSERGESGKPCQFTGEGRYSIHRSLGLSDPRSLLVACVLQITAFDSHQLRRWRNGVDHHHYSSIII